MMHLSIIDSKPTPSKPIAQTKKSPDKSFSLEEQKEKKKSSEPTQVACELPFPFTLPKEDLSEISKSEFLSIECALLAEKVLEKAHYVNQNGIEELSFTFSSSGCFNGINILLKRFDTYPIEFQVEFFASEEQLNTLEQNIQFLQQGFNEAQQDFILKLNAPMLKSFLDEKKPSKQSIQKVGKASHG